MKFQYSEKFLILNKYHVRYHVKNIIKYYLLLNKNNNTTIKVIKSRF
jgi:hypothetical protein